MKNRATIAHVLLVGTFLVPSLPAVAGSSADNWMFDCGSRMCIQPQRMCDGIDDCGNYADEKACSLDVLVRPPCSFACHNSTRCVQPSWVCDGVYDCGDGSDEKDCPEAKAAALYCRSATRPDPTPATPPADAALSNATGATPPSRDCNVSDGDFWCPDGRCLLAFQVCDRVRDCSDGADEGPLCQLNIGRTDAVGWWTSACSFACCSSRCRIRTT
ncbi:hypothetical protein HPB52_008467 [Rhipicephalus sanguineus]|uniref:Uncharacterized protein n=1 Tax=Rhipicephalus sanguineus TaxID=34632 RepID=A0A9D4T793_RHISA|nr:hypothetical protein HPB52_008467 [Rhipicephalus sanguineus]